MRPTIHIPPARGRYEDFVVTATDTREVCSAATDPVPTAHGDLSTTRLYCTRAKDGHTEHKAGGVFVVGEGVVVYATWTDK